VYTAVLIIAGMVVNLYTNSALPVTVKIKQ